MASKFKVTLGRLPDFKLPVEVVLPNGEDGKIVFTVKHLKSSEIQKLFGESENVTKDIDFLKALATGWDLEEDFTDENLAELVELYPGFVVSLTTSYVRALAGQRVKN